MSWAIWRETQGPSNSLGMTGWEWIDVGLGERVTEIVRRQAFALRRPVLPQDDGVGWVAGSGGGGDVNGGGRECPPYIFWLT